jgi:hypothetical protein
MSNLPNLVVDSWNPNSNTCATSGVGTKIAKISDQKNLRNPEIIQWK